MSIDTLSPLICIRMCLCLCTYVCRCLCVCVCLLACYSNNIHFCYLTCLMETKQIRGLLYTRVCICLCNGGLVPLTGRIRIYVFFRGQVKETVLGYACFTSYHVCVAQVHEYVLVYVVCSETIPTCTTPNWSTTSKCQTIHKKPNMGELGSRLYIRTGKRVWYIGSVQYKWKVLVRQNGQSKLNLIGHL